MKKLFTYLLCTLFFGSAFGQLATVSGGNIGASVAGGYLQNKPTGNGFGFSAGLTTSFYELFFPEVDYSHLSYDFGKDTSGALLSGRSNYLGLGLNNKVPIGSIAMGKSSKLECWYLNLKLLIDYKYRFGLGNNNKFDPKNQSGFNFGLGINPSFSGSHKSRVAWSFFYDFYYHLDINKSDFSSISSTQQNGFYIRFTLLHYKTSDMLGGGSGKKKSYKKKY